jgi:hypothetical protein
MSNDEHDEHVDAPSAPSPFCIQPHDPQALAIIRVWIMTARSMKVNEDKLMKAEIHFKEIREWQKVNGTKIPD